MYIQILKNGPFIPMEKIDESTNGDMVILTHYDPKDPSEYTEPENEKVSLDSGLQLILTESIDNVMYNNIVNYDIAKQIWEKIEILCEGIEEVRSNPSRIMVSQYEGFMEKSKEGITEVFERFNKLINDLQHDKYYEAEEVNLKFLLALPNHIEQKISAIREGRCAAFPYTPTYECNNSLVASPLFWPMDPCSDASTCTLPLPVFCLMETPSLKASAATYY
ncbi:hypothetical protein AgCh_017183 [Apium graveolens]